MKIKRVLGNRVMIKKADAAVEVGDLVIQDDGESLPKAIIVLVGEDVDHIVSVGDLVHYTQARESGKCDHNGEPHFIVPIANIVAVLST